MLTRLLIFLIATTTCLAQQDWRVKLKQELPLLGHRNWIAIVDSAYPLQTSPGIETVETYMDQTTLLKEVLAMLQGAPHVAPTVYLDAELPYLQESEAKGVDQYRSQLKQSLMGYSPVSLPHEQIIAKLDDAGKTFHVLILKTRLTVPYTSVFLQLDCAYWDAAAEKRLRVRMMKH
jgi:hypothetical protein